MSVRWKSQEWAWSLGASGYTRVLTEDESGGGRFATDRTGQSGILSEAEEGQQRCVDYLEPVGTT